MNLLFSSLSIMFSLGFALCCTVAGYHDLWYRRIRHVNPQQAHLHKLKRRDFSFYGAGCFVCFAVYFLLYLASR